ncbi:two-component system, NarL family, sensor histidine kinase DesK [Streptomyces sp. Ag82_O1-12]|uniref:sensor histidine kinase n=1 Tax=unclassified Streptomyces TaxID=2593676 RepID=UPI000BC9ACFF|nr:MULTISPECIES: sensor histidine kinase [unclassified Streptomyces]SMQ17391.1 two-component system, NarL family, sensor histidine kinase DesK [Streptomyces sp. Ag82_O1-12]SOD46425.1 two-component system, NarL family, sensor histidine kinase DesK [Streptomyces sp. Ag82_G6-1]
MRTPGRWWRHKTTPEKVESYTRWSFHFFAVMEFFSVGLTSVAPLGIRLGSAAMLVVAVHAGLCFVTVSRAIDWTRGRRPQPTGLMWTLAAVTAAIAAAALGLAELGPDREGVDSAAGGVFGVILIFGPGIIALGVRSRRRAFGIAGGFAAGTAVMAITLGAPVLTALFTALIVLLGGMFIAFTAVFSVWLLNSVFELDEARETRARLAVAEERLRFGRDLHDVMGRNLAVIALKSELAVQLAQRGRPEAVTQMVEVQRLAHESQREVREVVRGYREADLGSELAGAQGVLAAAGIDCTVGGATAAGLPAAVQSALGWVVREAATNVLRHGDARRCAVRLQMLEGRVVLSVENDGVSEAGTASGNGPSGSGLAGLRERLAEIDGTLEAGPAGQGLFRLTAEIPLPSQPGLTGAVPAAVAAPSVSEVTP